MDGKCALDERLRADFLPPQLRPLLVVGHASLVRRVQIVWPVGGGGPVGLGSLQRAVAVLTAVLRAVDDDVDGSAVAEMAVAVGVLKLPEWGFLVLEIRMFTKKVISPPPPPRMLSRRGSPRRRSSPSWWSACGT